MARHRKTLEMLRLATLDQVKAFRGNLVKNHRGHRDIFRIETVDDHGRPLTLFLKRNLKPYRKDGLTSLCRRGRVMSTSREEWENSRALAEAGFETAALVAYGEDCGFLWERYSYLITEAAPSAQTLADFVLHCRDRGIRRRVLLALAAWVRRLHEVGLASPDLFARHIFVRETGAQPAFCLIDMARLDRKRSLRLAVRARDLAALNVSLAATRVSPRERLAFLRAYDGREWRVLAARIGRRMVHLLKRRRFRRSFYQESSK